MVWWYNPTNPTGTTDQTGEEVTSAGHRVLVYRAYLSTLKVDTGYFTGGGDSIFNRANHNMTLISSPYTDSISDRRTNESSTKMDQLFIPLGTTSLTFDMNCDLEFGKGICAAGSIRLIVLLFRDAAGQDEIDGGSTYDALIAARGFTRETYDLGNETPEFKPEDELNEERATELHYLTEDVHRDILVGLSDPYV